MQPLFQIIRAYNRQRIGKPFFAQTPAQAAVDVLKARGYCCRIVRCSWRRCIARGQFEPWLLHPRRNDEANCKKQ